MIEIHNLKKQYEDHLVWSHVNFSLAEDQVYCLMGPSGRGKTTLLRCLAGLERADAGTITGLEGKKIAMVFQEDRLLMEMSAVANCRLVGIPRPEPILAEILPAECLHQPVSELSGGMKRRVAVARAMAAEADVILMDEPFTGLDRETREQVIDFIRRYRRDRLLILATHNEADAEQLNAERMLLS